MSTHSQKTQTPTARGYRRPEGQRAMGATGNSTLSALQQAADRSPVVNQLTALQRLADGRVQTNGPPRVELGDGAQQSDVTISDEAATVPAPALVQPTMQRAAVMQLFANSTAATDWMTAQRAAFTATPARTVRMQRYIDAFDEIAGIWGNYDSQLNKGYTEEAQTKLNDMLARAICLEQIEVNLQGLINDATAENATGEMAQALGFAAPDSWHRQYATAEQADRMTALFDLYNGEQEQRAARVAAFQKLLDRRVIPIDMETLAKASPDQITTAMDDKIAAICIAKPIAAHNPMLDDEIDQLQQAVEAAALTAVNLKFVTLNSLIEDIQAAHTDGSAIQDRAAVLAAFYDLHDDGALDRRDIDAKIIAANTLKDDARTFVNAQFAELADVYAQTKDLLDKAIGQPGRRALNDRLAPLRQFSVAHNDDALDGRAYAQTVEAAAELYSDVVDWEEGLWIEVGNDEPEPRNANNYYQAHIMDRHAQSSLAAGAGKFNTDDWGVIKGRIDAALAGGDQFGPVMNVRPNKPRGRFEFTLDSGAPMGITINGADTTRIFVVVTRSGKTVVTAYPIA